MSLGLGDTKLRICNFRAGEDINLAAMENTCHSGGMIRQTPSLDMDIITYFTRQTSSVFIAHNLILTKPKGHILCIYLTSYQNFTKSIQNYHHNFCFFWCETNYFKGGDEIKLEICPKIICVIMGERVEGFSPNQP